MHLKGKQRLNFFELRQNFVVAQLPTCQISSQCCGRLQKYLFVVIFVLTIEGN